MTNPRTGGHHPERWQAAVLFNLERLFFLCIAFEGGLSGLRRWWYATGQLVMLLTWKSSGYGFEVAYAVPLGRSFRVVLRVFSCSTSPRRRQALQGVSSEKFTGFQDGRHDSGGGLFYPAERLCVRLIWLWSPLKQVLWQRATCE